MRVIVALYLLSSVCQAADDLYGSARSAQEASIEKQRAAIHAQEASVAAQNPSFFASNLAEPVFEAPIDCEPAPDSKVRQMVDEEAKKSGVDTDLAHAVARKESAYNSCATSVKGAQGVMQLMPSVQAQFGVTDPYDPKQNISAGTRLLKQLLDMYGGDLSKALGAYNAGSARVDQFGGVPPFPETMQYVSGILSDIDKK